MLAPAAVKRRGHLSAASPRGSGAGASGRGRPRTRRRRRRRGGRGGTAPRSGSGWSRARCRPRGRRAGGRCARRASRRWSSGRRGRGRSQPGRPVRSPHQTPVELQLEAGPVAGEVLVELPPDLVGGLRVFQDPGRELPRKPREQLVALLVLERHVGEAARRDRHEQLPDRAPERRRGRRRGVQRRRRCSARAPPRPAPPDGRPRGHRRASSVPSRSSAPRSIDFMSSAPSASSRPGTRSPARPPPRSP